MSKVHSLLVLGALAIAGGMGAPVARELGREVPEIRPPPAPRRDEWDGEPLYATTPTRRGVHYLPAILGDAWADPAPRPDVPRNDLATIDAAERKRERKRAALLARKAGAK